MLMPVRPANIPLIGAVNRMEKNRRRRKAGFLLLFLGCAFFLLHGVHDEHLAFHSCDFLPVYSGGRCMVAGCDPYNPVALQKVDKTAGAQQGWFGDILSSENPVYPPTALFLATPLGSMPWRPAHLLWLALTGLSYVIAAWAMWDLCADFAPLLAGALVGAFVATSTLLMMTANPTGLATSLCLIAVWCVLRERLVALGVICLALSLLIKPQMGGFIWLYFLLASPGYRRFALKALAVIVAIAVPAVVWVSVMPASHHWLAELSNQVVRSLRPGGSSDPGIRNRTSYSFMNLQAIFSLIRDKPAVYDLESYAIFGPILLAWMLVTGKSKPSRAQTYLGLATGAALTLLPVYHRLYDVRLWLLMFPAAILLWARRGRRGWLALSCMVLATGIAVNPLLHLMQVHRLTFYDGPLWLQLAGRPYAFLALAITGIFLWMDVLEVRKAQPEARAEVAGYGAAANLE